MNKKTETQYQAEISHLKQQLAALATERDQHRRHGAAPTTGALSPPPCVEPSPPAAAAAPGARSPGHSYRAATVAGVVLSLGALANILLYHDAQSTLQSPPPLSDPQANGETTPFTALEVVPDDGYRADETLTKEDSQTPAPQTRRPKTRFVRTGRGTVHQWGPALLPASGESAAVGAFDPVVQRQQRALRALGFAIGKADGFSGRRTRQALKEFDALYLSALKKPPSGSALAAIIANYANLARSDARSFGIDQGVLAAIRLSSVRTGVQFSYLMKLAAVESNFEPRSESAASSATGLYQFTRSTWLNAIKTHGAKYGLGAYAAQIDYRVDRNGYQWPRVRDKAVYRHLMALRKNPRISAMMAAESVKDSVQRLTRSFDRQPTEADLYLTHFFGTDGAISFLEALDKTPDAPAVDIFPAAAQSNQDIFHPKTCKPRTVDEVYTLFGQKFNNDHYEVAAY